VGEGKLLDPSEEEKGQAIRRGGGGGKRIARPVGKKKDWLLDSCQEEKGSFISSGGGKIDPCARMNGGKGGDCFSGEKVVDLLLPVEGGGKSQTWPVGHRKKTRRGKKRRNAQGNRGKQESVRRSRKKRSQH